MNDETQDTNRATAWVVAALIGAALVLLILFARGPEDQERSGATLPVAAVQTTA